VRGHFITPPTTVHLGATQGVYGEALVGVDGDAEKAGIGLQGGISNQSPILDVSLKKRVQKLRVRLVRRIAGTGISSQTSEFCIPVPRCMRKRFTV
jgi:hypothetical protein